MKALTRNFLSLLLGDALYRLAGFLATAYLARVLGQEGFGVINFCLAVLSYAMFASNNGLTVTGTRIVSGKTGDLLPSVNAVVFLRLVHALAAALLLIAVLFLIYGPTEIFFISAAYLAYLIPSVFLIEWFFQGREQMLPIAAGRLIGIGVYLFFIYCFVSDRQNILLTPVGYVLGAAVNGIFLMIYFYRSGMRLKFRFDLRQMKPIWLSSIPVSLSTSMTQLALQAPPLFLAFYGTFESVGVYSVAFRLITMILVFDRLLGFLFFPAVCRWIQNKSGLNENLKRSVRIVTSFAFVFLLSIVVISEYLIEFAFGSQYRESVLIMQILAGYACLTFVNSVLSYTLIGLKRENAYLRSLIWSAGGFLICLIAFSEDVHPAGPSVALVVFEYISFLMMNYHLKTRLSMRPAFTVTLAFGVVWISVYYFMYVSLFAGFVNIIMVFLTVIPFIVLLTGIRISDFRYMKKIAL